MVANGTQLEARRTKCLNYRFSSNSTHSAAVSLFWRFQGPGKPRFHNILKSILYLRQGLQFTPQKEVQACQPGWKNNPNRHPNGHREPKRLPTALKEMPKAAEGLPKGAQRDARALPRPQSVQGRPQRHPKTRKCINKTFPDHPTHEKARDPMVTSPFQIHFII